MLDRTVEVLCGGNSYVNERPVPSMPHGTESMGSRYA